MAEPDYLSIVMTRDYPRTIALADGGEVVVRPLQAADEAALLAYFHGIPADERLRVFRENVVDPVVVAAWCREIDPRRVLSLVAVEGGTIVADATLHRDLRFIKSHVGELRLSVAPGHRHRGIGRRMTLEILDLAPQLGLAWVDVEAVADDSDAVPLLRELEFLEIGRLPGHARDITGATADLVLFTRRVDPSFDSDIGGQE